MTRNKLGLFSLTMIVIGLVIGTGIFRTSKDAAEASATPRIFFTAWIAGGLVGAGPRLRGERGGRGALRQGHRQHRGEGDRGAGPDPPSDAVHVASPVAHETPVLGRSERCGHLLPSPLPPGR